MAKYINAAEAAERVAEATGINIADLMDVFAEIPAADVAPVRRGHWIEGNGFQICSVCGEEHEWDEYRATYCDVCGAEMEVDNG